MNSAKHVKILKKHFKLFVVGGGSAGAGVSSKFSRKLPAGSVAVVEPHELHFYQPGFTLVGSGLMQLQQTRMKERAVLHSAAAWIPEKVTKFNPDENKLLLSNGDEVSYEFLVVAMGVEPRFNLIKGCVDALREAPEVCSNYSPEFVEKTFRAASKIESGIALFTYPNGPIKCAGAPQKACYLSDEILRKRGVREKTKVIYATSLSKVFGVEKYANSLMDVVRQKDIDLRTLHNLIEVDHTRRIATFEILDKEAKPTGETAQVEYAMLHVAPVCTPPEALRTSPLADANGFVDVDGSTLQSKKFANVFAVGDCANTGNAKTAAAISSQLKALEKNLDDVMAGKKPSAKYDGYASCPLVVGGSKCVLAEFNSAGPMETTPMNQAKPAYWAYFLKRYGMPFLYWNLFVKGYWNGPATIRKILHLGTKQEV